jgi:hypothetical protein
MHLKWKNGVENKNDRAVAEGIGKWVLILAVNDNAYAG